MVPFTRLHFLISGFAPLTSRNTQQYCVRVNPSDVRLILRPVSPLPLPHYAQAIFLFRRLLVPSCAGRAGAGPRLSSHTILALVNKCFETAEKLNFILHEKLNFHWSSLACKNWSTFHLKSVNWKIIGAEFKQDSKKVNETRLKTFHQRIRAQNA